MVSFNNYLENLVYPKERLNPDTFRKGKLFIYSLFFFLALMSLVTPLIALTSEEQAAFAFLYNGFIALIFVAIVFLYKRFGMRTGLNSWVCHPNNSSKKVCLTNSNFNNESLLSTSPYLYPAWHSPLPLAYLIPDLADSQF